MKLTFTGRGSAFNAKEKNTNAYFIENNILFLIDCGESVFSTFIENDLLKDIKEVYVVVSHTHSDHCASLGSFGLYCQFILNTKLKIVVPHNEEYIHDLKQLMKIFGNTDKAYEMIYEEEVDHKFQAFDSIRYELTKHDFMLTCYSFVFETNHGAIFYSADTRTVDNLLNFVNTHEMIDCIYMEVTDLNIVNDVHLSLDKLIEALDDKIKDKIYLMHLRNDECIKKVIDNGFKIVDCLN